MISKHLLSVLAVILVICMIAPPIVSAAEYVDKTINLEIESSNQGVHDEVVNVANASSIQNPDTWNPAPQGIWIGSSTKESKFKFDAIATTENRLQVGSVVKFNKTQIMNGVSEFIVRSPISSDGVLTQTLAIIQFTGNASYELESRTATDFSGGSYVAFITVNMTDVSITTGDDCWTIDDRTYVLVRCPIYSGYNYALIWTAEYAVDESFTIYVSGQDIVNDNILETQVSYYTRPAVDVYNEFVKTFEVDPGISFDCLTGLGNGIFANSFYMKAGDTVSFHVSNGALPEAYHTIMIPFGTDDGTLNATVTVQMYNINVLVPFWSNGSRVWNDYILASTNTTIIAGTWSPLLVTITMNEDKRVNWIFSDSPTGTPIDYFQDRSVITTEGIQHTVFSRVWNSYQVSLYQIFAPSMNPSDFPAAMQPVQEDKATWYGTIIGACLVIIGGAMIATGFLAPVGAVIAGIGVTMIIADIAKGGHLIESGTLPGFLENALDKVREFFEDVGEFLLSIGEGLWDALTWLVDGIVEYGSYLLGLLIIGAALLIFFFPIHYQLKLWTSALLLAQGKVAQAQKGVEEVATDIGNKASTIGKVL